MATSVAVSGLGTGLASQIDTTSLISKLVALEQQPLTNLQTQEAAYKSQVSALGSISSALSALQTAAKNLSSSGALGVTASSSNTDFTATPGSSAAAGSYQVQVDQLASAAKWRSQAFAAGATLQKGNFTISADGNDYTVAVAQDETLTQLVSDIRSSGAPVSAALLNDGTSNYLSITATNSGYTGTDPSSALLVTFLADQSGEQGYDPTQFSTQQDAQNASFSIDGLQFTRRSNLVSDALPGTTIALTKNEGVAETLTLANDTSSTQQKIQTYVDAYNAVIKLVQAQLDISSSTDRTSTLAGDSTIRGLQQELQGLTSSMASGLTDVRSLADLGIKAQDDGSLTIDSSVLSDAIARDPAAVNAIFADSSGSVSQLTSKLVDTYTLPVTGLLALRQDGLTQQISQMDDQATQMQAQITAYQDSLTQQFSAMQSIVSGLQSVSDFLTAQANAIAAQANG